MINKKSVFLTAIIATLLSCFDVNAGKDSNRNPNQRYSQYSNKTQINQGLIVSECAIQDQCIQADEFKKMHSVKDKGVQTDVIKPVFTFQNNESKKVLHAQINDMHKQLNQRDLRVHELERKIAAMNSIMLNMNESEDLAIQANMRLQNKYDALQKQYEELNYSYNLMKEQKIELMKNCYQLQMKAHNPSVWRKHKVAKQSDEESDVNMNINQMNTFI